MTVVMGQSQKFCEPTFFKVSELRDFLILVYYVVQNFLKQMNCEIY